MSLILEARRSSGSVWRTTIPWRSALDLTGHRQGVDAKYLGEVGDSGRSRRQRVWEEQGGAGPVEPDACQLQEPLVQAHLGDRPGDGLQRLVEPVDVKG